MHTVCLKLCINLKFIITTFNFFLQLFINYSASAFSVSKAERQAFLQKKFNFTCDCQACSENWPHVRLARNERSERQKVKNFFIYVPNN